MTPPPPLPKKLSVAKYVENNGMENGKKVEEGPTKIAGQN